MRVLCSTTPNDGPSTCRGAAAEVARLLADRTYADGSARIAAAFAELPRPAEAVSVLARLARSRG